MCVPQNDSIQEDKLENPNQSYIEVFGAKEHNLKNIDVRIPRNQLVVITGISGSGKSSLAFDTIYAEGQRRYMESFSAYARSFIGEMKRPDVDKIEGLSPVIAIEQKTTSRNPRSTVGTITEIYDFLRLFFARVGEAYSYVTGEKMQKQSEDQIIDQILHNFESQKVSILAPIVKGRKGHYRELFLQLRKSGYAKVRINGEIQDLVSGMQLDRYKTHDIEVVIDRLEIKEKDRYRLAQSIQAALKEGEGIVSILSQKDELRAYSKYLMCPTSGIAYQDPAPNSFSFNSPYGACPTCKGLGKIEEITQAAIIPDPNLSISAGGIAPLGVYRDVWIFKKLEAILEKYKLKISTPIKDIPKNVVDIILYGTDEHIPVDSKKYAGEQWYTRYEGIVNFLEKQQEYGTEKTRQWIQDYIQIRVCEDCNGTKLKKEALYFLIDNKNIAQLNQMTLNSLQNWFEGLESRLSERQNSIATEILKEIRKRLGFLLNVGLDYLHLDRPMHSLSGGEAQRIRLATQVGTQLVGVLYILDEPSIGLHQRDNNRLIKALQDLRDLGNSVIVVEHDKDMMLAADYVIDIGLGAGRHGGRIVAEGTPKDFLEKNSLTAQYLKNQIRIEVPKIRREGSGKNLVLSHATGHNLKDVTFSLPLGKLVCVTGVSGSGKSSLIHHTLFPILNHYFFNAKKEPLPYQSIEGLELIDKVIEIDQSPIGRTPRSNPATYTNVFTEIRKLFSELTESKIRGYKVGRFSFNVKGGRCEKCEGVGMQNIEMGFLPDILIECDECRGKRFNRETLEIRFKSKSIADILDMTVEEAVVFFESQPKIYRVIKTLSDVGLGYITLGQHATTLSGGEAQRVKLATELARKDTGKTLYILDEPTTGLHFQDIRVLLDLLNRLVEKGNTVLVIEHNLDVIKVADHVIDLGLEGGDKGGHIICEGTPEQIAACEQSHTGQFLKMELA